MSKQQTAVEWLMPNILGLHLQLANNRISQRNCELKILQLFEQAKEMEEKQIRDAWKDGDRRYTGYGDSETYYDEIFKEEE